MSCIDEWNPVLPHVKEEASRPPPAARGAPNLVGTIYDGLMAMRPQPPAAVHFYLGEGLRWIRVGLNGDRAIEPSAVEHVGRIIESCAAPAGPLFFHALRPHDMLFFLEGGDAESIGMPPGYFGAPLDEVLHAWSNGPSVASRKTRAAARRTKPRSK